MEEKEDTRKLTERSVSLAEMKGSDGSLHPMPLGLDDPWRLLAQHPWHYMPDCCACELVRLLIRRDVWVSVRIVFASSESSAGRKLMRFCRLEDLGSVLPASILWHGTGRTILSPPYKRGVSGDACLPPENTVVFFV